MTAAGGSSEVLALKELIEEGDGEGGVAVGGTVDHPFGDQVGSARGHRLDFDAQFGGDVAGPVGARAQSGHCSQISLLLRGQPVESDSEEVFVESSDHFGAA